MDTLPIRVSSIPVKKVEHEQKETSLDNFFKKLEFEITYEKLKSLCSEINLEIFITRSLENQNGLVDGLFVYTIQIPTSFGFELIGSGHSINEAVDDTVKNFKHTSLLYDFLKRRDELDSILRSQEFLRDSNMSSKWQTD